MSVADLIFSKQSKHVLSGIPSTVASIFPLTPSWQPASIHRCRGDISSALEGRQRLIHCSLLIRVFLVVSSGLVLVLVQMTAIAAAKA